MTKWKTVTRIWLVSIVSLVTLMLGMRAGNSQQPDPLPPIPASGPPLISITPDEDAAGGNQLSPEEQERAIDEALNNLWQHVPDLERHQMQPLQVQAENGLIAFVGTDGHLYLMNPDGSAQVPLVTNLENLLHPVWSPGDDYLAFIGDGDDGRCLYKLQMSNRNQTSLACGFNEIWGPRWSPDSSYLAFWGREVADQPYQAWVIAASGGTVVEVAPDLTTAVTPDWIDNDTAVFAGEAVENTWHIYRVDITQPDNPQPITPAITPRCVGVFAAYPVLSPDGTHIAYMGARSVDDKWGGSDCYYAVYLVDPEGQTTPSKIADVADTVQTHHGSVGTMYWAPDNQRVGLLASGPDNILRLNIVNTATGNVTALHGREGGSWQGWNWSPDGTRMVAGFLPPEGSWEVDEVNPATDVFTPTAEGASPAWSELPLLEPVDLEVTGIEVTQATQSITNSIPLIQGKSTWVRVFARSNPTDVNNVSAKLYLTKDGQEREVEPMNGQITVRADGGSRSELSHTFNFLLPIDWMTNTIEVRVEVGPDKQFYELDYDNNIFPPMSQLPKTLSFEATSTITIYSYRFNFVDPDGTKHVVSHTEAESSMDYTRWTYPIADNGLPGLVDKGEITVNRDDIDLRIVTGWSALLDRLPCNAQVNNHERCIGWIPPEVQPRPNHIWGYANSPEAISNIGYGSLVAHELGHTFRGSGHPDCAQIDNYGFHGNEETQQVYTPPKYFDFMNDNTPCGLLTDYQWVSSREYLVIKNRLMPTSNTLLGVEYTNSLQPYLGVSGVITPGLKAEFRSLYTITRTVGFDDGPGSGPFRIELLDTNEQVLFSRYFSGGSPSGEDIEEGIYFHEVMPRPAGTIKIAIWDGTTKLEELSTSPNIPEVQLLTPLDGLTLDNEITLEWTAFDADGDSLLYLVEYSPDAGQSWEILAINLTESSFTVDTKYLQGTTQGKIRVLASDGLNTGADLSDGFFSIGKHAPSVSILAPQDGARVVPRIVINLVGSGYDLEDGILPDSTLSWSLDGVTPLGNGGLVSVEQLGYGSHTISLTAVDSDGQSSTASITITVTDYPLQVFLPTVSKGGP